MATTLETEGLAVSPQTKRHDCRMCHVMGRSVWSCLTQSELQKLNDGVTRREYAAGEVIYTMGQPNTGIFCISSGTVAVRRFDADGNSVLLYLAYQDDILGYRSWLMGGEHKTTAETLEPSVVCTVAANAVQSLLDDNPELGLQFLKRSIKEVEKAHDAIVETATRSNRQRFVHLLLVLMKRHGGEVDGLERQIRLPLTRRDMASMIGTRHETVSRIIGRLESEGLASFSGRKVTVPNVEALYKELQPHDSL